MIKHIFLKPRRITFLIALLSISMTSYASDYGAGYDDGYDDGYDEAMYDCPCPPWYYLKSGFYGGLSLGYEGLQIDRHPWVLDDPVGKFNTHANGWNGRLFGGYGWYYQNYYLGGELFLGTTGAEGRDSITTMTQYHGQFSAGTSVGASILPGFRLTKSGPLVYGRLGVIQTDFTVKDESTFSSSKSNWTTGLNVGLGLEIPIYKNISGRLEYDYMNYQSIDNNTSTGSHNSPVDNRASIDILYHLPN